MGLIDALKSIPDRRTRPRYPQWVILALMIFGYRALSRFVSRPKRRYSK